MTVYKDNFGDTLEVEDFRGLGKDGVIRLTQAGRSSVFGLKENMRIPLATELLKPMDCVVLEGPLPEVTVTKLNGRTRIVSGSIYAEVSETERDYFLSRARQSLAIAKGVERHMESEEEERQKRLAEIETEKAKLAERRTQLAQKFGGRHVDYNNITETARVAIDRVIELEDAAK